MKRAADNLFASRPKRLTREAVDPLIAGRGFRLERIVSQGHVTPPGEWYDQENAEWVVLLSGRAKLLFAGEKKARALRPGDWVSIPARRRHRVEWTDPKQRTVWLALHHSSGARRS